MQVERLSSRHQLAAFTSGVKQLDEWLKAHALDNQNRDLSRTFVLVEDDGAVVGYDSLTMGGVRKHQPPPPYWRGLPDVDIGMVLLGRLAIACSCDSTRSAPHWKRQRDPDNFGIVGRYFSKALSASFGARDDLGAGARDISPDTTRYVPAQPKRKTGASAS
jgi:hypothetical protein